MLKKLGLLGNVIAVVTCAGIAGITALVVLSNFFIHKSLLAANDELTAEGHEALAQSFKDEAATLLGYSYLASVDPQISEAMKSRDASKLKQALVGRFQQLHSRNDTVSSVEVTDAQGIILMRGHNPSKFGDDKSKTGLFGSALRSRLSQVGMEVSSFVGKAEY